MRVESLLFLEKQFNIVLFFGGRFKHIIMSIRVLPLLLFILESVPERAVKQFILAVLFFRTLSGLVDIDMVVGLFPPVTENAISHLGTPAFRKHKTKANPPWW